MFLQGSLQFFTGVVVRLFTVPSVLDPCQTMPNLKYFGKGVNGTELLDGV